MHCNSKYIDQPTVKKSIISFFTIPVIALSFLLLLTTAFLDVPTSYAASKKSRKISLSGPSGASGKYYIDGRYTFTLKNAGSNISWSVSKKRLAAVKKKNGNKALLTPVKKGSFYLRAVYRKKTYKTKITLKAARMQSSKSTLYPGDTSTFYLKGVSSGVTWSVSDKSIATIKKISTKKARLTAIKTGTVTVACKFKGITYRKQIKIIAPSLTAANMSFDNLTPQKLTIKGVASAAAKEVTSWSSIEKKSYKNTTLFWAIENPLLVSVQMTGMNEITITPKKTGTTRIAARYRGNTSYVNIQVILPENEEEKKPDPVNENQLSLPELDLPEDIPEYWEEELAKSIVVAQERDNAAGRKLPSFFFLTDTHWKNNAGYSPAIINYLTGQLSVPFTIFGGDAVTGSYTGVNEDGQNAHEQALDELNTFYSAFNQDIRILSMVGNHDTNSGSGENDYNGDRLTNEEIYTAMLKDYESEDFLVIGPDLLDSYYDDKEAKIRYISFFFDNVHYEDVTDEKLQWISDRVTELTSDWTVVMLSHAYWKPVSIDLINKGQGDSHTNTATKIGSYLANLQASSDATIALWLVGHCHRDTDSWIPSNDGNTGIKVVSTNCDKYIGSESLGGWPMEKGTATEQAMDLVQIDTESHHIYLTRIGAGKNRDFTY